MAASEALSASANSSPRSEPSARRTQTLRWRRRSLWLFVLFAGAAALAMSVSNEGRDGVQPDRFKIMRERIAATAREARDAPGMLF